MNETQISYQAPTTEHFGRTPLSGPQSKAKVAAALAKAQLAFRAIVKDKQATVQMRDNKGKYTYSYADLASVMEVIRQPLADNELSISQQTRFRNGGLWLDSFLIHSSGEYLDAEYPLPQPGQGGPQAMGSAITYARRYSLGALLGIVTEEDDDGKKAKPKTITKGQYNTLLEAVKTAGLNKDDFVSMTKEIAGHQNPTRLTEDQFEAFLKKLNGKGQKSLADV